MIFTEKSFKDYFKQFVQIPENKIKINPRGFRFNEPRELESKRKTEGTIHIGFIGSLISRKGIDLTLKAFEKILHLENFVLDIYASDTIPIYLDKIKVLEKAYPGKIKFYGGFKNTALYSIAESIDFALVPSNFDTFNRVVRELMYFAVPLIVTDFFGASIIENNVNGIKIPIGDSDALADSILYLLENPDMIEKLSAGVIDTYIHTVDDEINGIYNFYKEISIQTGIKPKTQTDYAKIIQAEACIEKDNYREAKELLQEVLTKNNNNADALNDLSVISIIENDYNGAFKYINQVLEFDPINDVAKENKNYLSSLAEFEWSKRFKL